MSDIPDPDAYRWRVDTQFLLGMRAGQWLRLLREVGFDVDARYLHRAALISAFSLYNSLASRLDGLRRGPPAAPAASPLFVIGHWRSGTTLLFDLLARDPARTWPNAYQSVNPESFRTTEALGTRLFGGLVPDTRPQDAMPLGFHLPEEDEYAVALMGGGSPYLGRCFPRLEERFLPHLTCDSPDQEQALVAALRRFLGLLASVDPRPVVLKSPPHTARLRLLLSAFPDARFVHIHRDPYRVYRSTLHLWDTCGRLWCLQEPPPERREASVLAAYARMHDAYFDQRDLVPPGQLVEVAYADLVADPMATLAGIYDRLDLPGFEAARPEMQAWLDEIGGYRTNTYPPLPEATRQTVATAWRRSFEAWGYAT